MKRFVCILLAVLMMSLVSACKDEKEIPEPIKPTSISSDDQAKMKQDGKIMSDSEFEKVQKAFVPAGKIYGEKTKDTPDLTQELAFDYDNKLRIITVYYLIDKDQYISSYTYDDENKKLTITTFFEGVVVDEKVFTYDKINTTQGVGIVDGYYVSNPEITQ